MKISFKGINNIKIEKKEYSKTGFYQRLNKNIGYGKKDYTELRITANLTDDKKGDHLRDYLKRTPAEFINKSEPDKIELHLLNLDIPDDNVNLSFFRFNNKNLILVDDCLLPLMTFLARFTREGGQNPDLSENQRKYLNLANNAISKEAMEYIDLR